MQMRSKEEITALLFQLLTDFSVERCSDYNVREQASVVAQALSWVLGNELSPNELLRDNIEEHEQMNVHCSSNAILNEKDEF